MTLKPIHRKVVTGYFAVGVSFAIFTPNYGYTCACLDVDTDSSQMKITWIQSSQALPLSTCQEDPNLSPW
jgi:hypothetical protein